MKAKQFFFEKKNKKTFDPLRAGFGRAKPTRSGQKFFCCFFFKKSSACVPLTQYGTFRSLSAHTW
jgi:hypothetical protein